MSGSDKSVAVESFDDSESIALSGVDEEAYNKQLEKIFGRKIQPVLATRYGDPREFEDPLYTEFYPEVKEEEEYIKTIPVHDRLGLSQMVRRKKTEWKDPPPREELSYMELEVPRLSQESKDEYDRLKDQLIKERDAVLPRQMPPIPIRDLHIREQAEFQTLYEELEDSQDIEHLRNWIMDNIAFVCEYRIVFPQLVEIVKTYGAREDREWASREVQPIETATAEDWDCGAYMRLLHIIWNLLEDCHRQGALKEGGELLRYYEFPLQARMLAQSYEILKHRFAELHREKEAAVQREKDEKEAALRAMMKQIKELKGRPRVFVEPKNLQEFIDELQNEKEKSEILSSSFKKMAEQEKRSKDELFQKLTESEIRAMELEEYTKEIAGTSREIDLLNELRNAITSRIQSLTADPAVIEKAVRDWMKTAQQVLEHKEREINQILDNHKDLEKRRQQLFIDINKKERGAADIARIQSTPKGKTSRIPKMKESLVKKGKKIVKSAGESAGKARRLFKRDLPSPDTPGTLRAPMSPDYVEFPEQLEHFEIDETPPSIPSDSVSPSRGMQIVPFPLPSPTEPSSSEFETTPQPRTPFVSKSRFGYTDPTVPLRQLNIPPGPSFEMPTPFRQTVVLTSPKRAEPLVVNIEVDPKPLTVTEQGESFICDIALNVQPGRQNLSPQLQASGVESPHKSNRIYGLSDSPIVKGRLVGRRNAIPDVTSSSTCREFGLYTPKGILKKGRFNIRRIPGRHPIPELPWSPTYLPEDARSPVSSLLSSPMQWSDRSVSWEKQYESDYASSPSTSPLIKRPRYGYPSSDSGDLTSPVIQGPGYRYQSTDSEELTYSSPVIKRAGYRYESPDSEELSYSSPVIKRQAYRHRYPESDALSSSPVIKGPGYRHQSPDLERSPSPLIRGSIYRQPSPDSDHSSTSPTFHKKFGRYPSPVSSPLFDTPPSGYQTALERSATPQSSPSLYSSNYQDPYYQRIQLDEMQVPGMPGRMNVSDSMDSERDYLEGSLDSSLLNEERFLS